MLQLTPLDQTTAGKQIFARGLDKGEFIGKIHFAQKLLEQPLSLKEELAKKTENELKTILGLLEAQLGSSSRTH